MAKARDLSNLSSSPAMEQDPVPSGDATAAVVSSNAQGSSAQSAVSISDDGGQGPQIGSAATFSKQQNASQAKSAVEDNPHSRAYEQHGTKRPAGSESGPTRAKRPKVEEVTASGVADKVTKEESSQLMTIEECKEKANGIIKKKNEIIADIKAHLAVCETQLAKTEASRDDYMATQIAQTAKENAREADRKDKVARQKEWRKTVTGEIRAALQQNYTAQLQNKTVSIEKRLSSKYATAEKNLSRKLQEKTEKLDNALEELRSLKEDHKEEIRLLKAKIKETAKEGNPKAQQKLKECQEELKAKEKELEEADGALEALEKKLTHSAAETNAEKTQKNDLNKAYVNACEENRKLEAKIKHMQRDFALQEKDVEAAKQSMQQMQATYEEKLTQAERKWQLQANNSAESQNRVVVGHRTVFALKNSNDRLQRQVVEHQKKIRDLEADKRQKEHEVQKFREEFVELDVAPLDALQSTSKARSAGGNVEAEVLGTDSESTVLDPERATGAEMQDVVAELDGGDYETTSWGFPTDV
ncbi:hypothetical protein BST61_g10079 [Cercospora zeina]